MAKSYGIRGITIAFLNSTSSKSDYFCFRSIQNHNISSRCNCSNTTQYYDPSDDTCKSCDSKCETCTDGAISLCVTCKFPYILFNGHCLTCPENCTSCGVGAICQQCVSGQYVYNNNTCSTCKPPYIIRGTNCDVPCASNEYLYLNGTCTENCFFPYQVNSLADLQYCIPLCPSNSFTLPTNSCNITCEAPMIESTLYESRICSAPCLTSQFFDAINQACIPTCDSPSISIDRIYYVECQDIASNTNSTNSTNSTSNSTNLNSTSNITRNSTNNGTSNSTNNTTNASSTINATNSTSNTSNASLIIGSIAPSTAVTVTQGMTQASITVSTIGAAFSSSGAGVSAFGLLTLNRFLFYMRFLKINFPENLREYFIMGNNTASLSLGISFPTGDMTFPSNPVEPSVFDGWGLSSSFLANYWQIISTIILSMGVLIFIILLEKMFSRSKKLEVLYFLDQFKALVKWNFALIQFCTGYDSVTLYASIEFRTNRFESDVAIVSFLLAVVCIILELVFLILTYKLARGNHIAKNQTVPESVIRFYSPEHIYFRKWKSFQILFAGYKDNSIFAQILIFFFMVRNILWICIIAFLYDYPIAQALLMTLISLSMVLLMLFKRPFINRVSKFEIPTLEIIIFFVSANMLALSILDSAENPNESAKETVGQFIIVGFTAFGITGFIAMAGYLILGSMNSYKTYKRMKSAGTMSFIMMITIPFVSYGMDFKEFESELKHLIYKEKRIKPVTIDLRSDSKKSLAIDSTKHLMTASSNFITNIIPNDTEQDEPIHENKLQLLNDLTRPTSSIKVDPEHQLEFTQKLSYKSNLDDSFRSDGSFRGTPSRFKLHMMTAVIGKRGSLCRASEGSSPMSVMDEVIPNGARSNSSNENELEFAQTPNHIHSKFISYRRDSHRTTVVQKRNDFDLEKLEDV